MIKILTYSTDSIRDSKLNSAFSLYNKIYPLEHNRITGSLFDEIAYLKPDVLFVDTCHERLTEVSTIVKLHQKFPELKIFLELNEESRQEILNYIDMGVQGYVMKSESIFIILKGIDFWNRIAHLYLLAWHFV